MWRDGDRRRDVDSTARDGMTAPRRCLDGEGRRERNGDGDGQRDDDSMVMDSGAQLNSDGRRVGDTTTMDDEEGMSATAMLTWPTMEATKANAASRHYT